LARQLANRSSLKLPPGPFALSMAAMKSVAQLAFVLGPLLAVGVSPIAKVLELLSDVQAKIIADGQEAQKTFSKFTELCEDRSKKLSYEIKTGKGEEAELTASVSKSVALIGSLNAKIEELAAGIASDEADLSAAEKVRAKEAADFATEEKELMDVVDMLERATGILEREMEKGGASMLQLKGASSIAQAFSVMVQASVLSSRDGEKLAALVQRSKEDEGDASLGAPDPAVYEGHSGDIIETLEGLSEKAKAQLAEARKEETAALHNFDMLKQSLTDDIRIANKEMDQAKKALAESGEHKATAQGELTVTKKELHADIVSLADLHHDCMTRAQDFEASQKTLDEEMKAIAEAKKVIAETTGDAERITYGLAQIQPSFLQVARSRMGTGADLAGYEAVRQVRDLARRHRSSALAQLATRMNVALRSGAGSDPFAKIKGLISDMIDRLEDEADADATQKEYCDKQLSETQDKKEEKSAEIEKLANKVAQMASRSAQLKEEVAALQKSLSELAAAQAEMDELRKVESAEFAKGKADMEQGLEGIKTALKVLREYYGQRDGANEGAGASIIGLLEVIESDISQALAGLISAEESAQSAYEKETNEHEVERASKQQDVKYKEREATGLDSAIAEAKSEISSVQTELDAVLEYLGTLNKQCVSKPEPYEERKGRREAEIAGLKEALGALEGQAVLLQRQSRRTLRGPRRHAVA